jgi:cell division ATPase FtsA
MRLLRVIGVGETQSMGVRRGAVVDTEAVAKACHMALEHAERMSGHVSERSFHFSFGRGYSLSRSERSRGGESARWRGWGG